MLRDLRRARGWSQARLMHELERLAAAEGSALPGRDSLRVMVSRWENGRATPDDVYRRHLSAVYHVETAELFPDTSAQQAPESPAVSLPDVPLQLPERVTPDLLGYLESAYEQYVAADNMLGSGPLLPLVSTQAGLISAMSGSVPPGQRSQLLDLGSRYAEFSGWLCQDAGDLSGAQRWSDVALTYAREGGDGRQLAYILMRKSNIAGDAGDGALALALAEASLHGEGVRAESPEPRLRAVVLRQRAVAGSMLGDETTTARALESAFEEVAGLQAPDDTLSYCTSGYVASEAGSCWLRLGRPAKAVSALRYGLACWPDGLPRDRSLLLTRLARAHVAIGELEAAGAAVTDAVALTRTTASSRTRAELRLLRSELATEALPVQARWLTEELARL